MPRLHAICWSHRIGYSLLIWLLLLSTNPTSGQYQQPWGNRYTPRGYRPTSGFPNASGLNSQGLSSPQYPQPDANGIVTIRKSFAQTPINTRTPGIARSPKDFQKMDFRNPSLQLLKQLGELTPAAGGDTKRKYPRMFAEFEPQKAILLSLADLMEQHHAVFQDIVRKTANHVEVVVLVNDIQQLKTGVRLVAESGATDHVSFAILKLNTIWLRDFGPQFAERPEGYEVLDFLYDGTRPLDERLPATWSHATGDQGRKVSWTLQGGNLITNGAGLGITSTRLFEDNMIRFPQPTPGMNVEYERRKIVVENFKQECNLDRLIFLHPLAPEATKHVDMFATFLAEDHILVARVDPRRDRYNAHVLDVNARLLASLTVAGKPMRVDRIEMPIRNGRYWSPFTNIIRANNLILIPRYASDPPEMVANAIATYQKFLPEAIVKTVDMTSMQKLEGALHCMSINIPAKAKLPLQRLSFAEAQRQLPQGFASSTSQPESRPSPPHVAQKTAPKAITGPAKNRNSASPRRSTSDVIAKQREAALTYRRTFRDATGRFQVDGLAVGISGNVASLIRLTDGREIQLRISQLSATDQQWFRNNMDKIRVNGPLVREFHQRFGVAN